MTVRFNSAEKNDFLKNYCDNNTKARLAEVVIVSRLGAIEERLDKAFDMFTKTEVDEAIAEIRSMYKSHLSFSVTMVIIQDFLREQKIKSEATDYVLGMNFKEGCD